MGSCLVRFLYSPIIIKCDSDACIINLWGCVEIFSPVLYKDRLGGQRTNIRKIFTVEQLTKNPATNVASDLNQVKRKLKLCCDMKREEIFAQICRR